MKIIFQLAVFALLTAPAAYAVNGASTEYNKAISDGQRGSRGGSTPMSPAMRHQMMLDNQRLHDQLNAERTSELGQQPASSPARARSRSSGMPHSSHTARHKRGGKSKDTGKGGTSHTFSSTLTATPDKAEDVPMIPNLPPPPAPPVPPGAASSFTAPAAPSLDPSKIDVPGVTPAGKLNEMMQYGLSGNRGSGRAALRQRCPAWIYAA